MATRRDPQQRPYIPLRAKVTRARKSKDREKILNTAREVVEYFNAHMWPDQWRSWRNDLTDSLAWDDPYRWQIEEMFG